MDEVGHAIHKYSERSIEVKLPAHLEHFGMTYQPTDRPGHRKVSLAISVYFIFSKYHTFNFNPYLGICISFILSDMTLN